MTDYLLVESDDIEVSITATNAFGTSDLSVVGSVK
jgi:hypothetical protein